MSYIALIYTQFVVLKHLLLELSANRNPLKLILCWERQFSGRQPRWDRSARRTWVEGLVLGANICQTLLFLSFRQFLQFQFTFTFSHLGWGFGEKLVGWPFHVCKTIIIKYGKFTKPCSDDLFAIADQFNLSTDCFYQTALG